MISPGIISPGRIPPPLQIPKLTLPQARTALPKLPDFATFLKDENFPPNCTRPKLFPPPPLVCLSLVL